MSQDRVEGHVKVLGTFLSPAKSLEGEELVVIAFDTGVQKTHLGQN